MSAESKFKVTTKIRAILLDFPEIKSMVGEQVFPVIAPKGTKGDFIIYQRDKYAKERTQMGIYDQSCQVFVSAVSEDYDRSQHLAYQINEALEGRHIDLNIDVRLLDSTEDYADGKYIQIILFEIK